MVKVILNGEAQYINLELTLYPGENEVPDALWERVCIGNAWLQYLIKMGIVFTRAEGILAPTAELESAEVILKTEEPTKTAPENPVDVKTELPRKTTKKKAENAL